MQRIWNEEELKSNYFYSIQEGQWWFHPKFDSPSGIYFKMIGKSVEWCIEKRYIVQDWMIATTEDKTQNKVLEFKETERNEIIRFQDDGKIFVHGKEVEFKTQNNMETKKVTLNNGTVLESGNSYVWDLDGSKEKIKILHIGDTHFFYKDDGSEYSNIINTNHNMALYTEPTTQKEWKTFMIETLSQKTDIPYRFFSQYYSVEDAREHHKRAISIIEVKLNIEPVNNPNK